MAKEIKNKMSEARYAELKEELNILQTVRVKEVTAQLKEARSFGDFSENSELDEAKVEHGKVHSRIAEIKNLLDNAEIIQVSDATDRVGMGSVVVLRDHAAGRDETYVVVGSQEADPMQGKISDESPIGRSVLGRMVGETVDVETPAGTLRFEILKIES